MNDPFDGVYQIKRSSAASYLLQIKWLVACQSWGGDIRFDTRGVFVPEFDGDVLEVVGRGDASSLGLTMERMERVEQAMTNAATAAGQAEKPNVDVGNDLSASDAADGQPVIKEPTKSISIDINISKPEIADTTIGNIPKTPSAKDYLPNTKRQIDNSVEEAQSAPENIVRTPEQRGAHISGSHPEQEPTLNGVKPKQTASVETASKPSMGSIQKEQVSNYFRRLSGFREDTSVDAPTVYIPTNQSGHSSSGAKSDRHTTASAYFRSVGGFIN